MRIKRVLLNSSLIATLILMTGCAYPNPPIGLITAVQYPHVQACTSGEIGSKTGKSSVTMILFISAGDASVRKAANNGGITKIKTIDHQFLSFFGIVQIYRTIVTGD